MPRSGIMLAYPYDAKRLSRWDSPYIVQPKLNGVRARTINVRGLTTLLSSEGNPITGVEHINSTIDALNLDQEITLDGELYTHGMPFEKIVSIAKRTVNTHEGAYKLQYHIFDIRHSSEALRQKQRSEFLERLGVYIMSFRTDIIQVVPSYAAYTEENIQYLLEKYMKEGYEGLILRNPSAFYQEKRTTDMMKLKPRQEDSYTITGFQQEVSKDGVPKESMGALVLRDAGGEEFKVGTGPYLTRPMRQKLWEDRFTLIGHTAFLVYQDLTEDRMVPRFPVLMRIE